MAALGILASGCRALAPVTETEVPAATRQAAIERADWERAVEVRIELRDYGFAPAQLRLKHGQAYRLTVFNSGGVAHYFNAPEFMRSIAPRQVIVKDQVEIIAPQFGSFEVARRGGSFTFEFIPLVKGSYRAWCHLAGDEHKGVHGQLVVE